MSFTRTKENFVCEHCGANVIGNGYTNHCPDCLWSKHVDVDPGDRAATCGGMMRPVRVVVDGDSYTITHKCELCGYTKNNRGSTEDNVDSIIAIMQANA